MTVQDWHKESTKMRLEHLVPECQEGKSDRDMSEQTKISNGKGFHRSDLK